MRFRPQLAPDSFRSMADTALAVCAAMWHLCTCSHIIHTPSDASVLPTEAFAFRIAAPIGSDGEKGCALLMDRPWLPSSGGEVATFLDARCAVGRHIMA